MGELKNRPEASLFRAAVRKSGIENWRWCISEMIGEDFLIHGAVPIGKYTKGPRKGRDKWPPKSQMERFIVTQGDIDAEDQRWEKEHQKCFKCFGEGQEWNGWNCETGNKFITCRRCKGDGTPRKYNMNKEPTHDTQ